MKIYLRWTKSSRCAFPFVFDVSEETTVSDICKMVIKENNSNHNNPTFSIVKLRANDNTDHVFMPPDRKIGGILFWPICHCMCPCVPKL